MQTAETKRKSYVEEVFEGKIQSSVAEKLNAYQNDIEISKEEIKTIHSTFNIHELSLLALKRRFLLNRDKIVTFLIDRNINYTNICVTECKFCAFYRFPDEKDSYVLSYEAIARKIEELLKYGGTRILLQGGHNPKLRLSYYIDLLTFIKKNFPAINIDGFSPSEIEFISRVEKMDIESVLKELKKAGLDGLPGGGAEILVDRIREVIAPKKQKSESWLDVMEIAHKLNLTTTATMVIGFGETFDERLEHLEKIRILQKKSVSRGSKGFISFILWTAQHHNTRLSHLKYTDNFYTTAYDYLEMVAISRIFLNNIVHIGASWPTMGEKIASIALLYGADDFGGTMIEENVVSQASPSYKTFMKPSEIISSIKSAGFIPAQRDSNYNILKIYE
ncbi:MAG: cyclic dehypoxanthinyl futalosine synthase [Planctomycetota bacterium]